MVILMLFTSKIYYSGSNVTNVKLGNIKSVLCSMAEEMTVGKLSTLALIAIYKRLKGESVSHCHRVLFWGPKTYQGQYSATT